MTNTRQIDPMAFGVGKVGARRWQAFACLYRRADVRFVGPVFRSQWEAAQYARHLSERRRESFDARRDHR